MWMWLRSERRRRRKKKSTICNRMIARTYYFSNGHWGLLTIWYVAYFDLFWPIKVFFPLLRFLYQIDLLGTLHCSSYKEDDVFQSELTSRLIHSPHRQRGSE